MMLACRLFLTGTDAVGLFLNQTLGAASLRSLALVAVALTRVCNKPQFGGFIGMRIGKAAKFAGGID